MVENLSKPVIRTDIIIHQNGKIRARVKPSHC